MAESEGTSQEWTDAERCKVLQQTLSEARAHRKQKQGMNRNDGPSSSDDKKTEIRNHPLLPVIQLLREKCEMAAGTMRKSSFEIDDVVKLLATMKEQDIDIHTEDEELDEFMWTTVIMLRTQLAELQKVESLAENFLAKYLGALRQLVSHENLVGTSIDSDDEGMSPENSNLLRNSSLATLTTADGTVSIPLQIPPHRFQEQMVKPNLETRSDSKFDFKSIENSQFATSTQTIVPWLPFQLPAKPTSERQTESERQSSTN